jgi:hypothetical protein
MRLNQYRDDDDDLDAIFGMGSYGDNDELMYDWIENL